MQAIAHLHFNGACEEAFGFYAECLGGTIETMMRAEGSPAAGVMPPDWQDKIIHARLEVGDALIMGMDAPPGHYSRPQGFHVTLEVDTPAEAERVFRALSDGGSVTMAMEQTFFAVRFGMLVDRFGIPWMVTCPQPA